MKKFLTLLFLFKISFAQTLILSAAASLRDVSKDLIKSFEEKNPMCKVYLNTGASGKLAIQIVNGAPVDIFLSASKKWADFVDKKGFSLRKKEILSNKLVLVTYKDAPYNTFKDIYKASKIAIGNYKFAPFGKYAYETLKNLHIFEKLKSRFVYANNVNQALSYILSKNVDFAIIYYTDYLKAKDKLKLVYVFPNNLHKKISYYALLLKHAGNNKCAKDFYNYLFNQEAKSIFKKYGFKVIKEK